MLPSIEIIKISEIYVYIINTEDKVRAKSINIRLEFTIFPPIIFRAA